MKPISMRRRALFGGVGIAVLLLCAACGGDGDGTGVANSITSTTAMQKSGATEINWKYDSVSAGQNDKVNLIDDNGVNRSFYVSFSKRYDSSATHKLVVIFPGTDTSGQEMQAWLGAGWAKTGTDPRNGIEYYMTNTVFVYPDALIREFPGYAADDPTSMDPWKGRGWLLGGNGTQDRPVVDGDTEAAGNADIHFIQQLIPGLQKKFGVSDKNVFMTGHSWGGDMAAVMTCYLGKDVGGSVPVAANKPYWFYDETKVVDANLTGVPIACLTHGTPVWTWFGNNDEHFAAVERADADLVGEKPAGYYGRMQYKFWKFDRFGDPATLSNCKDDALVINSSNLRDVGNSKTNKQISVVAQGCPNASIVRLTSYDKDYSGIGDTPGHYPPDYFGREVAGWFNSLATSN
ncbi:hypothetical protein [Burkholderia cepacia]|uniref:hypothetical protein n=1 Tax=Burkholderia cepacia TaxID=292 RepID=UPI0012D97211|nr:hypothetical protein [Burkholderia cepacia]